MRYLALALAAVVLAAGCTGQGFSPTNLKEVKDFIKDYPNAQIKTAAYSPEDITDVLPQYKADCPGLGKEGKSYTKLTVIDPDTNVDLVVWLGEDYAVVCSILNPLAKTAKTTTTVTAKQADGNICETHGECISSLCLNKICSTPGSGSQTTTPTTTFPTTFLITTTSMATTANTTTTAPTTTTVANTTTTAIATTTTANTTTTLPTTTTLNTTTTTSPYPDLIGNLDYVVGPMPGTKVFGFTIRNIGGSSVNIPFKFKVEALLNDVLKGNCNSTISTPVDQAGFNSGTCSMYLNTTGTYTIRTTVDVDSVVAEATRANNINTTTVGL